MAGDIVNQFGIRFWNNFFYCTVRFPDGASQELKSATDLTYKQWQEKIAAAWSAHTAPPPPPEECKCPNCEKPFVCPNRTI